MADDRRQNISWSSVFSLPSSANREFAGYVGFLAIFITGAGSFNYLTKISRAGR
jgi:hypothetical protein